MGVRTGNPHHQFAIRLCEFLHTEWTGGSHRPLQRANIGVWHHTIIITGMTTAMRTLITRRHG
jgi:hypothetical protein